MTDLKTKMREQAAALRGETPAASPPDPARAFAAQLERALPEIARALPRHLTAERLARVALTQMRVVPGLAQCEPLSILAAVFQAAQLGLEPGVLGQCYILPYQDRKTGRKVAQFLIGYQGYLTLAYRSGALQSLTVRAVYAGDEFAVDLGLEEALHYRPAPDAQRDPTHLQSVFLVVRYKDGGHYLDVMWRDEIEAHRRRSPAADRGPWVTDYEMMARKTIIRRAWRYLPLAVEDRTLLARAAAAEERVYTGTALDFAAAVLPEPADESEALAAEGPTPEAELPAATGSTGPVGDAAPEAPAPAPPEQGVLL